jgi:hypothetical protein
MSFQQLAELEAVLFRAAWPLWIPIKRKTLPRIIDPDFDWEERQL